MLYMLVFTPVLSAEKKLRGIGLKNESSLQMLFINAEVILQKFDREKVGDLYQLLNNYYSIKNIFIYIFPLKMLFNNRYNFVTCVFQI